MGFEVDLSVAKANSLRCNLERKPALKITRLRLLGFKSFVDPTELLIAPGLTGVVGPNGCGKSNLLEALRWVMGENRASAMRGDGMEDVIFAGASSRPPRNHAEVTLVIDNADRMAPVGFNDSDQIEVVRRITRDAGSAYRANGKEARARDVQMLFADASTGAHSPSLVRQGQIAELINAKPTARRRVLEEAAGISGLYQRRHEAELKLKATETNLERVADVLEQLETQLRQLERQARQAARYREIADELRQFEGLLMYRRWREADLARLAADGALTAAVRVTAAAIAAATEAAERRGKAEAVLPALREEDVIAAALVQRLALERASLNEQAGRAHQAIAALQHESRQLAADREREQALNRDAVETIARLKQEAEAIAEAGLGHEDRLKAAVGEAHQAASNLGEAEALLDEATGDAARLAARQTAALRRLEEARVAAARAGTDAEKARADVAAAATQLQGLQQAHDSMVGVEAEATLKAATADRLLAQAEAERASLQAADYDTRSALSQIEGELRALEGEYTGLQRIIARDRSEDGSVLDGIKVKSGFELALGAALGDDLKLAEIGETGATGWAAGGGSAKANALPDGARPLLEQVNAPPVLTARLNQTGIVARADGARLQKLLGTGQRLVSVEGDLWRWDGLRVAASDQSSASALRLQQANRLAELQAAVTASRSHADAAKAASAASRARLEAAQQTEHSCRHERRESDEAATRAARELSRAVAELNGLTGRIETLKLTSSHRLDEARQAEAALAEAEAGLGDSGALDKAQARLEATRTRVEAERILMMSKRAHADEVKRDFEARARRDQEIEREAKSWNSRLASASNRLDALDDRIETNAERLGAAMLLPGELAGKLEALERTAETEELRRRKAADALAAAETAFRAEEAAERAAERAASDAREERARAQALAEAAEGHLRHETEHLVSESGLQPAALLDQLAVDPQTMPDSDVLETDVQRLRRQREALGAVNLRADEDMREIAGERARLAGEKADLEAAISKFRQGIAGLNREGRERLLEAFDRVNRNFGRCSRPCSAAARRIWRWWKATIRWRPGWRSCAEPPGKKLSTLTLLSGGEQALTALSLIFAVFRANPGAGLRAGRGRCAAR